MGPHIFLYKTQCVAQIIIWLPYDFPCPCIMIPLNMQLHLLPGILPASMEWDKCYLIQQRSILSWHFTWSGIQATLEMDPAAELALGNCCLEPLWKMHQVVFPHCTFDSLHSQQVVWGSPGCREAIEGTVSLALRHRGHETLTNPCLYFIIFFHELSGVPWGEKKKNTGEQCNYIGAKYWRRIEPKHLSAIFFEFCTIWASTFLFIFHFLGNSIFVVNSYEWIHFVKPYYLTFFSSDSGLREVGLTLLVISGTNLHLTVKSVSYGWTNLVDLEAMPNNFD